MRMTAKEDEGTMKDVCDLWSKELAPQKCWADVDVQGRGCQLIQHVNKPGGECYAVITKLNHQSSNAVSSCVWCETRNMHQTAGDHMCPVDSCLGDQRGLRAVTRDLASRYKGAFAVP